MMTTKGPGCSLLLKFGNVTTTSSQKRRRMSSLRSIPEWRDSLTRRTSCRIYFSTSNRRGQSNDRTQRFTKAGDTDDSSSKAQPVSPSVWQQLQSIPNMITLTRMASTPILCYWIVHEDYTLAMYGCVLAAMSDGLDGYLAKHHGGSTVLGTYLDPLADKALVNGLGLSLWYVGILPPPLIMAWALKDVVLLSGTAWYLYQEQHTINFFDNSVATKPLTVTPTVLGKANTGLQFATLAVGILTPITSPEALPPVILQSLCWVTGFTSLASILSYSGKSGFKMDTNDKSIQGISDVKENGPGKQ